jgi:hypothetical protein
VKPAVNAGFSRTASWPDPAGNAVRGPAVHRDAGITRRFGMRVALYARVSRLDQEPDNQLHELR